LAAEVKVRLRPSAAGGDAAFEKKFFRDAQILAAHPMQVRDSRLVYGRDVFRRDITFLVVSPRGDVNRPFSRNSSILFLSKNFTTF